jgi:branched-chain amino acid transport system substrate-binding protein
MASIQALRAAKAAACVLALCAALAGCSPKVPDTVRIGVAVPLSGATANRGQDLLNGALLAAEELKAAGFKVGGRPVAFEIVAKDDAADPETVKKVAQELCDEDVQAVIGHLNSPNTATAVPVYAAKGMLLLTTSTQKSILSLGRGNVFRLVANDTVQARALAGFATDTLAATGIAVLVEDSDYGREMYADMAAALTGRSTVEPLRIDVDFKSAVTAEMVASIRQAAADVVIVIGRESHALSLLGKLKEARYLDVSVLTTNPAKTNKLAQSDVPVRGLFTTATVMEAGEWSGGNEFLNRFYARYESDPVWGAHYAYDAVYMLADMIRRAGSVKPADLMARLRMAEPNTRLIQMRFDAEGEQARPTVGVYKAERGQWMHQVRSASW